MSLQVGPTFLKAPLVAFKGSFVGSFKEGDVGPCKSNIKLYWKYCVFDGVQAISYGTLAWAIPFFKRI